MAEKKPVKLPPQRGEIKKKICADCFSEIKTLKYPESLGSNMFRKAGNAVRFLVRLQNPRRQYKFNKKATSATSNGCSIAVATRIFSCSGCCPKDGTSQRLLESP